MPSKPESVNTSNAGKIQVLSFYGGEVGCSSPGWVFVITGVTHQEAHLFNKLLFHITENYDDIIQTLHDGEGGLILHVKA